ncbi:SDR family oxidoreductase [Burkholderiales bacterium]|nr:SDR family oxidoreductase [Burkholderiales bacterium]
MDNLLVTGAFGYLGGRLIQALSSSGYQLTCGTRSKADRNLDWLPGARSAQLDWSSDESLRSSCRGIDCVVHLASMNEIQSRKHPIQALETNGVASLRLLEAAKRERVKRFIYISTAHVYGSPLQGYINEKTLPRPQHPYAITHKVSEEFVLAARDLKQIEGVVLRLSNGFGAPATPNVDRWTLLVNDLCRQAVSSSHLRLNSDGSQLRDFITLGDFTRAILHIISLDSDYLDNGLFNLGSGKSVSILKMAERVAARWRANSGREIDIMRPDGHALSPAPLNFCCEKLINTGFTLTSKVDDEIDATLELCNRVFAR